MKQNDLIKMARIASVAFQHAYIDNGTKDRYVRHDEILDNFLDMLREVILKSDYSKKERILDLYVYCLHEVKSMPDNGYKSEQWNNIVMAAKNHLVYLTEFKLGEWEKIIEEERKST
jgi:hypothetical protein